MAWTSPMTAVANSVFTAAQFNAHVRDNLNETAPAKASSAGRIIVTTGLNQVDERIVGESQIGTSETTASTSYTDLTTVGPSQSVLTGAQAFVVITCEMSNSGVFQCWAGVAVSGASIVAADDADAIQYHSFAAGSKHRGSAAALLTGLTPGTNVFTMKYRVAGGTGTFLNRKLFVMGL